MSVSRSTASPGAPGQTRRDEAWFDQLYARYKAHVMAYALRRIPTDADDVVACAFAAAWRKRDQAPERALPWLYAAASREVLHVLRSRSRREALGGRLAGHLEAVTPDHSAPADARLDAAVIVGEVLSRLPATDAEVLRLWAWEQLDPHEIALVLGIGPGAARVRLHRARRRLEAGIQRAQPQAPPEWKPEASSTTDTPHQQHRVEPSYE